MLWFWACEIFSLVVITLLPDCIRPGGVVDYYQQADLLPKDSHLWQHVQMHSRVHQLLHICFQKPEMGITACHIKFLLGTETHI